MSVSQLIRNVKPFRTPWISMSVDQYHEILAWCLLTYANDQSWDMDSSVNQGQRTLLVKFKFSYEDDLTLFLLTWSGDVDHST